jgi:hypothetical protein
VVARRERAVARLSMRMALEEQEEEQGGEQEERLLGRGKRSGTDTVKLLLDNKVELKGEEVKITPLDYADKDKLQPAATLSYTLYSRKQKQVARWM